MTQPVTSWVTDLLNRFGSQEKQRFIRPKPMEFQVNRPQYDPSSFYRDIQNMSQRSSNATSILNQRLAAQRAAEMARIPQQGIQAGTPQASFMPGGQRKTGRYGSPLSNYSVSSGYGPRNRPTAGASSNHRGIDMAAPTGTPIYATHDGVVGNAGWSNGYGYNVTLNAGNGVQTFYGHQSRLNVRSGQQVRRGQIIGYVGSTGVSTGPHLHYGVMVNGQWVNPSGYY